MNLPIKHKRGTTIPTANDLVVGEIAINTTTGVCYTKTAAGNVVAIGLDIAANWGNIGGTLSSQTDLQLALDDKYDASNPNNYIPEANADGNTYVRKNGMWEVMPTTDLTGYATETYVTTRGYLLIGDNGTVPSGGSSGQVLTKASNSNYSFIWSTPIVYDRYLTTSTTSLTVSNGAKTFTIGTGLSYTTQQDVTIAYDASNHMHAVVTSYDSATGVLVVDVQNHTGSGTYTSWTVNVGGSTPLTSLTWGGLTGTLSNQTDLQSALDGKANTSHTQDISTITGLQTALNSKYSTTNPAGYVTSSDLTMSLSSYLTTNAAATTYLSMSSAAANYLTQTSAANNYAALAGATFAGKVNLPAATTGGAYLNLGAGSTPTTLVNGDIWVDNVLRYRVGGGTVVTAGLAIAQTFTQPQVISTATSATLPALRITNQSTTAHSLLVEDAANPDSTPFIIDKDGRVGVGLTPDTIAAIKVDAGGIMFSDGTRQTTSAVGTGGATWGTIAGSLTNQLDLSAALALKADLAGATFTGKVNTPASTTANAGLNIGAGSAPTSPVAGDLWMQTAGNYLYYRAPAGVTYTLAMQQFSNTFSSPQIIDTTSNTLAGLRVTQKGTSPAIVVEDSINPDASAFIVDANGAVGVGVDPATWVAANKVEIIGNLLTTSGKAIHTPTNTDSPSLNIGSAGTNPANAVNGDVWISNAAAPKLSYKTGGVSYTCVAANAFNTFTGGVAVTGASVSQAQLAVTQTGAGTAVQITTTGAGNALIVEDSTSPDSDAFVINTNGNVGIGQNPATWTPTYKLEVNGAITATTPATGNESTLVATTAHVKSVIRGQVLTDSQNVYSIPSTAYPNNFVKKLDDGSNTVMTINIPTDSQSPIPIGTQFVISQDGNYGFQIQGLSGVVLKSAGGKYKSTGQYSVCTLIKTNTDEWYLAGDLTA